MKRFVVALILVALPFLAFAASDKYSNVGSGTKAVVAPGTAIALSSVSIPCGGVFISSYYEVSHDSTPPYVGGSGVLGGGFGTKALTATCRGLKVMSRDVIFIPVTNVNAVYVDSAYTADGVNFIYLY